MVFLTLKHAMKTKSYVRACALWKTNFQMELSCGDARKMVSIESLQFSDVYMYTLRHSTLIAVLGNQCDRPFSAYKTRTPRRFAALCASSISTFSSIFFFFRSSDPFFRQLGHSKGVDGRKAIASPYTSCREQKARRSGRSRPGRVPGLPAAVWARVW